MSATAPSGGAQANVAFSLGLGELAGGQETNYFDVWMYYPQLVVTLVVGDPDDPGVLRTLRADFDGSRVVVGNDPSHQTTEEHLAADVRISATCLMDWIRSSLPKLPSHGFDNKPRGPIDRHEWDGIPHGWRLWVLADTGKGLSARHLGRPNRPPDRITRLPALEI